jgi:hypothetical protein
MIAAQPNTHLRGRLRLPGPLDLLRSVDLKRLGPVTSAMFTIAVVNIKEAFAIVRANGATTLLGLASFQIARSLQLTWTVNLSTLSCA